MNRPQLTPSLSLVLIVLHVEHSRFPVVANRNPGLQYGLQHGDKMDLQPDNLSESKTGYVPDCTLFLVAYSSLQPKAACGAWCQGLYDMSCRKGGLLFGLFFLVHSPPAAPKMKCVGAEDGQKQCQRCKRANVESVLRLSLPSCPRYQRDAVRCIFEKHRRGRKPGSKSVLAVLRLFIFLNPSPGFQRPQKCSVVWKRVSSTRSESPSPQSPTCCPHSPTLATMVLPNHLSTGSFVETRMHPLALISHPTSSLH